MVAAAAGRAGAAVQAVIVGGGPAGDAVLAGLRDGGFTGEVTLVGAEPEPPYERPHLSKGYLLGAVPRDKLPLRPASQYEARLLLGDAVAAIDLDRRKVETAGGRVLAWDLLCLATGSTARRLAGFEEALYLRELPDADALRAVIASRPALRIVGAGFVGCEVAAAAALKGREVHVYEALEQPLLRVLGPELGAYVAGVHRSHGVDLHTGVRRLPALEPPVLVAVGSEPRAELARQAGLDVDGGIVVDGLGRTSVPEVFAAGDATRFFSPLYGRHIRVEHFQTAQRQGYAVGRAMAGGDQPYNEVPWFWSDQYDLNLQYAGAGLPWDEVVVRGELGRPPFTVFQLSAGSLVAAAGVDDHHTVARARRLMEQRVQLSRDRLADPRFDLRRALT